MRRTREAHLPPARVVILGAATTPLNHCDAPRAHPRLVHTVFLECTAGLTPLRIRTDHVGHDDHATLLYFLVLRSNPVATMNPVGSGVLALLDRCSSWKAGQGWRPCVYGLITLAMTTMQRCRASECQGLTPEPQ